MSKKSILCWPWSEYAKRTFGGADEAYMQSLRDHDVIFLQDLLNEHCDVNTVIKQLEGLGKELDYVFVYYPETIEIPHAIYACPYPLIAFVCESNVRYHVIRQYCDIFDFVVVDAKELFNSLTSEGVENVAYMNWWGYHPNYHKKTVDFSDRDIDVLFIGNLDSDVQDERGRILFEIASHGFSNVVITTGLYEGDYGRLINRAKIVFNLNVRGEINMRCFEAPATGAMLLVDDNPNVRSYYEPGEECVTYSRGNINEILQKIDYYIKHDSERIRIAERGHKRVQDYTYQNVVNKIITEILEKQDFSERILRRIGDFKTDIKYPLIAAKSGFTSSRSNDTPLKEYRRLEGSALKWNNTGVYYAVVKKSTDEAQGYLEAAYKSGCMIAGLNLAKVTNDLDRIIPIIDHVLLAETLLPSFDYEYICSGYRFYRRMSSLVQQSGLHANSLKLVEKLLRRDALLLKGQTLEKQGNIEIGIRSVQEAAEIEPNYDVYLALARLHAKSQDYSEAAKNYRESLYYKPLDPRLALQYIKAQKKAGKIDETIPFIRKWIAATEAIPIYGSLRESFEKHLK